MHAGTGVEQAVDQLDRRIRGDKCALHGRPGIERLADDLRAFDDEGPLDVTRALLPQQTTQALDLLVPEPQSRLLGPLVQLAFSPRDSSTNDANAAGSLTARSARTLRSTSTPA